MTGKQKHISIHSNSAIISGMRFCKHVWPLFHNWRCDFNMKKSRSRACFRFTWTGMYLQPPPPSFACVFQSLVSQSGVHASSSIVISRELMRNGDSQPYLRWSESESAFQQEPGVRGLHAQYSLGSVALGFLKSHRHLSCCVNGLTLTQSGHIQGPNVALPEALKARCWLCATPSHFHGGNSKALLQKV